MQILPIDPSLHRLILQGNRSPEGLQLTLGQQIAATVLKINEEGQLLLGFGAQKVWAARSDISVVEGQQLQLRVNQNGATVELQLLNTTAESSVENYELASLFQASNSRPGVAAASPDPARLLEALQQLLKNDSQLLTEPQSFQLRALLEPLTLDSDVTMLLPQLKNLIENSAVFFEAKLRTVLEAFDASPEEALQKVASDLKLLLAQLQQRPSSVSAIVVGESTQALAANPSLDLPATSHEPELLTSVVPETTRARELPHSRLPREWRARTTRSLADFACPDESVPRCGTETLNRGCGLASNRKAGADLDPSDHEWPGASAKASWCAGHPNGSIRY